MGVKHVFFIGTIFSLVFLACTGEKQMKVDVVEQASEWSQYLVSGNLDAHLDKMAHFVYSNEKEREQLKQNLRLLQSVFDGKNTVLDTTECFLKGNIVEHEGYYQAIVQQVRFYKALDVNYQLVHYVFAVSKNGEDWRFVDATDLNTKTIKVVFPELSPELKFDWQK